MNQYFSVEFEQEIDLDREQVFDFFADAKNLERITPPFLRFRIASQLPIEMCEGAEILYRLKIHGISVSWRTRIEVWEPPYRFVDAQLSGPYRSWWHDHRFESAEGGTLMLDQVLFTPALGRLGQFVAGPMVEGRLRSIFSHRARMIAGLFNGQRTGAA